VDSFGAGFDRLIALHPQEIQVGILKRLLGTPIVRHDAEWRMIYNSHPPYEVLQTSLIDFPSMQRMRRFARYWDLVGNSGNFVETTPWIWSGGLSPFNAFLHWSDWLYERTGRTDAIALVRLMELLFEFLTGELQLPANPVAEVLWNDYQRGGRHDKPGFLCNYLPAASRSPRRAGVRSLKRQARHTSGS